MSYHRSFPLILESYPRTLAVTVVWQIVLHYVTMESGRKGKFNRYLQRSRPFFFYRAPPPKKNIVTCMTDSLRFLVAGFCT